jgi:hypothetical protein
MSEAGRGGAMASACIFVGFENDWACRPESTCTPFLHNFITRSIRRNVALALVSKLAGHADTRITERVYLCLSDADIGTLGSAAANATEKRGRAKSQKATTPRRPICPCHGMFWTG